MGVVIIFVNYQVVGKGSTKLLRMLGGLQRKRAGWAWDAIATRHPLPVALIECNCLIYLTLYAAIKQLQRSVLSQLFVITRETSIENRSLYYNCCVIKCGSGILEQMLVIHNCAHNSTLDEYCIKDFTDLKQFDEQDLVKISYLL